MAARKGKKKEPEAAADTEAKAAATVEDAEKTENWADKQNSKLYEKAHKWYPKLVQAYKNRRDADDAIGEYWAIYNAEPDENQKYQGNSTGYLPVVRNAINARAKRALKQLFPSKFKHVDAVGTDQQRPVAALSMLEHYVRSTHLKSVCRSVLVAGDVTGQWNLYVDWVSTTRRVSGMIRRNPIVQSVDGEALEIEDVTEEVTEAKDEDITEQGPDIVDFAAEDLVVLPPTCNSIHKADVTCLKLRMSKDAVQQYVDDGIFILGEDTDVSDWIKDKKWPGDRNPDKSRSSDAGIKTEGTLEYALIYWAHAYMEFEKGKKSLAYIYYAGEDEIIGLVKADQWGQKRPILSAPVDRVSGSFFGISKVEPVKFLQWQINDSWNMGQDSAMYSMLPIVMTDPEKNPNYAMMVFGLASVWPVDPNSTKFASFPQLWKDAVQICQAGEAKIMESMDVNDMMMGRQPAGRKNAQAVGAQMQEQSVPIMDHAERFEEEILNPLMELFFEYDCQYRDEDLTVLSMGEIGVKASMQKIPPQQWGERYFFQWSGTDFVLNMQRMQQQISTMNVLRGIPPQQLNGRKLDITPILEILADNVFGAELSSRILIDDRNKYSVPPEIEDEMMVNGIMVEIHEGDDDMQHLQTHMEAGKATGDPAGLIRTHIQAHGQALQVKRQMAMGAAQQQQQQGSPGVPGGAGPGVAGTPRMGAQPQMPRPGQQPAGGIHPDSMPGGQPRG